MGTIAFRPVAASPAMLRASGAVGTILGVDWPVVPQLSGLLDDGAAGGLPLGCQEQCVGVLVEQFGQLAAEVDNVRRVAFRSRDTVEASGVRLIRGRGRVRRGVCPFHDAWPFVTFPDGVLATAFATHPQGRTAFPRLLARAARPAG